MGWWVWAWVWDIRLAIGPGQPPELELTGASARFTPGDAVPEAQPFTRNRLLPAPAPRHIPPGSSWDDQGAASGPITDPRLANRGRVSHPLAPLQRPELSAQAEQRRRHKQWQGPRNLRAGGDGNLADADGARTIAFETGHESQGIAGIEAGSEGNAAHSEAGHRRGEGESGVGADAAEGILEGGAGAAATVSNDRIAAGSADLGQHDFGNF